MTLFDNINEPSARLDFIILVNSTRTKIFSAKS